MATEYSLDVSLARETWQALDAFTQGYIEAAMWTLTDEDGHSLDYLGLHDIAAETIAKAKDDCRDFLEMCGNQYATNARYGHDFWLTRNGHGAGFWDRGLGKWGERLTDWAHSFGSADWYVGDDGNVYQA